MITPRCSNDRCLRSDEVHMPYNMNIYTLWCNSGSAQAIKPMLLRLYVIGLLYYLRPTGPGNL